MISEICKKPLPLWVGLGFCRWGYRSVESIPTTNPYPFLWVGVLAGMGMGTPKNTHGLPVPITKWNQEGKIVLPSNVWVPHSISGPWLYKWIEEYHWRNPGQKAANQMLFQVAAAITLAIPLQVATNQPLRRQLVHKGSVSWTGKDQ